MSDSIVVPIWRTAWPRWLKWHDYGPTFRQRWVLWVHPLGGTLLGLRAGLRRVWMSAACAKPLLLRPPPRRRRERPTKAPRVQLGGLVDHTKREQQRCAND
ncbi:MAG: hypothetical protein ACREYE_19490 [Gammaproteobacteria bacterium]